MFTQFVFLSRVSENYNFWIVRLLMCPETLNLICLIVTITSVATFAGQNPISEPQTEVATTLNLAEIKKAWTSFDRFDRHRSCDQN